MLGDIGINYPHSEYPDRLREFILVGDAALAPQFWKSMWDRPSYDSHPMHVHMLVDFLTHAVPFKLYGNGAPGVGVGKPWAGVVVGVIMSSCLVYDASPAMHNIIIALIYYLSFRLIDDLFQLPRKMLSLFTMKLIVNTYRDVMPSSFILLNFFQCVS